MNTWLFRQFSGSVPALASWQPTHQIAISALQHTLQIHRSRGHSVDPCKITGELEHRYSVCDGYELIAVYWLSTSALSVDAPESRTRSPRTSMPTSVH